MFSCFWVASSQIHFCSKVKRPPPLPLNGAEVAGERDVLLGGGATGSEGGIVLGPEGGLSGGLSGGAVGGAGLVLGITPTVVLGVCSILSGAVGGGGLSGGDLLGSDLGSVAREPRIVGGVHSGKSRGFGCGVLLGERGNIAGAVGHLV